MKNGSRNDVIRFSPGEVLYITVRQEDFLQYADPMLFLCLKCETYSLRSFFQAGLNAAWCQAEIWPEVP